MCSSASVSRPIAIKCRKLPRSEIWRVSMRVFYWTIIVSRKYGESENWKYELKNKIKNFDNSEN